jgi:hypothetical protein
MFDYSEAQSQREIDLIPHGTIATLQLTVRSGGAGEDGMLKRSQDGLCEMLDLEFVVVEGEYVRRKFWERFVLVGTTDGHARAIEISRGKLRAILESARGIKPDDVSPEARAARTVKLADFDAMRFIGKIGIEKGKDKGNSAGNYPDRNILLTAVTPDRKDWHAVEQTAHPPQAANATGHATSAASIPMVKPAWAS